MRLIGLACAALASIHVAAPNALSLSESPHSVPPPGYVVYSRLVGRWLPEEDMSGRYELFLLRVPGNGEPKRITNTSSDSGVKLGAAVWYPLFSPDGKQVLFTASSAPGNKNLDLLESPTYRRQGLNLLRIVLQGTEIKPITTDGNGYEHFIWSPDGERVAAVQTGWPPRDQLESWDLARAKRYVLTKRPDAESITDVFWSTDGQNVLFQVWSSSGRQDPNLYAVCRNGGEAKVLIEGSGNRFGYSFSPSGKRVAFVQDGVVYTANSDSSQVAAAMKRSETGGNVQWLRPQWSPDGRKLAGAEVTSGDAATQYKTALHVCDVIDRRDKVVVVLQDRVTGMKWSRDGQWIILTTLRAGQTDTPDPETGWYTYHREGLAAASVADGKLVVLKEPSEETKGITWFEAR